MTMTERLLEATKEIWDGYNETPFVKGIADGSLDHEKFKYYMIQDYLYLLDYTKVFSIGTAKAKSQDVTLRQTTTYPWDGVVTFTLGNDPSTGVPRLLRDDNLGGGAQSTIILK